MSQINAMLSVVGVLQPSEGAGLHLTDTERLKITTIQLTRKGRSLISAKEDSTVSLARHL